MAETLGIVASVVTTTSPSAVLTIACAPGESAEVIWSSPGAISGARVVRNISEDLGPFADGTRLVMRALIGAPTYDLAQGAGGATADTVLSSAQAMTSAQKAAMRDALGVGGTAVAIEHIPASTAWASSVTPASFVSRSGFMGGAVTFTPAGVTSPSATVTIVYSNDASSTLSSATLGSISANGAAVFALPSFASMPGLWLRVGLTSATGTGGTVGAILNMA